MPELPSIGAPLEVFQEQVYDYLRQEQEIETLSANATLGSQTWVLVDTSGGGITLTLPLASSGFKIYYIKNTGTNTVTINRAGNDTIDGATSWTLHAQYNVVTLVSDQSNWHVFERYAKLG